jgi:hypothetical protein
MDAPRGTRMPRLESDEATGISVPLDVVYKPWNLPRGRGPLMFAVTPRRQFCTGLASKTRGSLRAAGSNTNSNPFKVGGVRALA